MTRQSHRLLVIFDNDRQRETFEDIVKQLNYAALRDEGTIVDASVLASVDVAGHADSKAFDGVTTIVYPIYLSTTRIEGQFDSDRFKKAKLFAKKMCSNSETALSSSL